MGSFALTAVPPAGPAVAGDAKLTLGWFGLLPHATNVSATAPAT
jgi:hypothetical protein